MEHFQCDTCTTVEFDVQMNEKPEDSTDMWEVGVGCGRNVH